MMQADANHQSQILILWQWEVKEETLDQEQNQIAQRALLLQYEAWKKQNKALIKLHYRQETIAE